MTWWHLGTAAVVATLLGLVWWMPGSSTPDRLLSTAALVAFAALWAAWGQRLVRQRLARQRLGRQLLGRQRAGSATGYLGAGILVTAVGVYGEPNILILQCLLLPLIWVLAGDNRRAIALNVGATLLFAAAYALGLGATPALWTEALFIEALSLGFSIALGLWIDSIAELGRQKARLYDDLAAAQDRLAALSRDAGAAAERERIARDMHDTIAQTLTGIVLTAQRGRRAAEVGGVEVSGVQAGGGEIGGAVETADLFELIETMGRDALNETRGLVATLAAVPGAGTDASLEQTVRRVAERFARETGVRVDVEADDLPPLSRELEVVLLRCAQEGLANVRKHARASAAVITLQARDGWAEMRLDDDGRGYPDAVARVAAAGDDQSVGALDGAGFGLTGMRERLALVGGTVRIRTLKSPHGASLGASLTATVPVDARSTPGAEAGTTPTPAGPGSAL